MQADTHIIFIIAAALTLLIGAAKRLRRRKKRTEGTLPAGEYRNAEDGSVYVAAAGYITRTKQSGYITTVVSYDYVYREGRIFLSRPNEFMTFPLELTEDGFLLNGKAYKKQERVKPREDK